jgi:hypothetical protein
MRWVFHVARMKTKRIALQIVGRKTLKMRQLGKSMCICEDNIETDVRE